MDVLASFQPRPGERERVEAALGPVAWLEDGLDPEARVLLSMFPQGEMRKAGAGWDGLPRLELVQLLTAGANHVGWRELPPGVRVATAAGATGPAIAEYVLGAVIAWARGFQRHTQDIRQGRFTMGAPVLGVRDLRVGVVGHGGIGSAAAGLLAAQGAEVAAVSRSGKGPSAHLAWLGTMDQLPELAARSQVLVVALPHNRHTEGLVDAALLARMPEPSLLVNVARGPVVDQQALHDWLHTGDRWAHLDVWWRYPKGGQGEGHPWDLPFQNLPNVTMTPHNSSNAPGHREAMIDAAVANVRHFLESGEVLHEQEPADYVADG